MVLMVAFKNLQQVIANGPLPSHISFHLRHSRGEMGYDGCARQLDQRHAAIENSA
jgi:hypothetical protein